MDARSSSSRAMTRARFFASPIFIPRSLAARCGWRWTRKAPTRRRRKASSISATSPCAERARSIGSPARPRIPAVFGRGILTPACRVHPLTWLVSSSVRESCAARRSAPRSMATSITSGTKCACAERSSRSMASTTCSARSRSSGCSSAAATKACSGSHMRWWARPAPLSCGSIRSRRWRPACCASSSNSRPRPAGRKAYAAPQSYPAR